MLYHNIIVLWEHRRICGTSLTETSLCGAYLYSTDQVLRKPGGIVIRVHYFYPKRNKTRHSGIQWVRIWKSVSESSLNTVYDDIITEGLLTRREDS
jgi:hypothetical protein